MHNSATRDLLLESAYLPHDQKGPPPTSEVKTLIPYAGVQKLELLLGCDANTHHTICDSTGTNKRENCHQKKSGSWDEHKASLIRYNRALRKAKRDSWKKYCQELEAVPECSRIRKVLAREGLSRIETLSKSNGTKAETEKQVLQHLLEVHFPGSEIIQTQFGGECKGLRYLTLEHET
ncbi:hypothetical protein Trydic_g7521 [Trypoxylus dichotomus]